MIGKVDIDYSSLLQEEYGNKINSLVDAVNTIQKEREAERFEIQEWIGILEAVRKSVNKLETMAKNTNTVLESLVQENNIHEKQIDELQMKLEPHKCEPNAQDMYDNAILDALKDKQVDVVVEPADNSEKANCQENVEPDYVTTSYMTDGHTKEYYGQNGASIATDYPSPAGYIIAINEPETKGGDNE